MKRTIAGIALSAAALAACGSGPATVAQGRNTEGARPVAFQAFGNRLAGNLYLPAGHEPGKQYPAVVVSHPWGGVKEQTAGFYAQQLARRGFVTLAYDASHYGESGGVPRDFEDPARRVADIRGAVGFLATLPEVDAGAIGTLGICAGGGYTLHEAQGDPRVKAVAAVAAYDIGGAAREGIAGSPVTRADRERLAAAAAAEWTRMAAGAEPTVADLLPDRSQWTDRTDAFTREAFGYYRTARGSHPRARNKVCVASLGLHAAYYPLERMDALAGRPVLLVAGEKAETRKFSEEAYARASGPKELLVVPGVTHFALYDRPECTGPALERLAGFFREALGAGSARKATDDKEGNR